MKVFFALGEASGDALAAALLAAAREGREVEAVGLAGPALQALGVRSLFDISELSIMGLSAVLQRLPQLVRRVYQTVDAVVRERPDVLVLVDSPDFTHAVAKRVRRRLPDLPIVDYVCPSVWAWRQNRAREMAHFIDHVLAILPFEPQLLAELGGPPATYVGHPLAALPEPDDAARMEPPTLLVLPGSRRSETQRLLPTFGATLDVLRRRGAGFDAVLPAVPHLRAQAEAAAATWAVPVRVVDAVPQGAAFVGATAALAASGTVSLELAMRGVPMVLAYELDPVARRMRSLIRTWSIALPNHVADRVVVPENVEEYAKPERLARQVEDLLTQTATRRAQVVGLADMRQRIRTERPAAEAAAEVVLRYASEGRSAA